MATRMIQRRGTSAEWTAANPVLAAGEIGFETDTQKFKFGDGTTAWADITYFASADQLIDGAPELLDTLNELAAALGDDPDFVTTVNASISSLESDTSLLLNTKVTIYSDGSSPTSTDLLPGDFWYDTSNGKLYIYHTLDSEATSFVWVEMGGSSTIEDAATGANRNDFSLTPTDGDTHNGYIYDGSRSAWVIDRSTNVVDNSDVNTSALSDDDVLMYNASASEFENVPGVRLDTDLEIPLSYLAKALSAIRSTATSSTFVDLETEIAQNATAIAANTADIATNNADIASNTTEIANTNNTINTLKGSVTVDFDTLEKIESYLVAQTTIQTEAEWTADATVLPVGSINVSTGSATRIKVGDGINTWSNLEYIPTNAYIDSTIATALAPLAPKADPTFSGTVSLPSTTSIGNVSDAEIAHLDGVTSGIQGQLDSLDTLKAPIADPTFTGTVSGVDKTMVGLSNVDNTSDVNKPVSTAQQAALDAKLDLAGGTLTGNLILNGDPTQALGAVTKQYVDSVEAGLISRPAVKAATTTNLSGTYTNGTAGADAQINLGQLATLDIDGITTWDQYDGILVKDQTNKAENGRYVVLQIGNATDTDWILKRCPLCDEADEIPGSYIFVTDGTTNEQTGWVQHVDDPATFTVGTDDIDVYQFAGAGAVTAGTNVSVAGNQVSVVDAPTFAGTVDASAAGVTFSDGTQTQAGVPSLTTFVEKTASYQLDTLDHKDNVVEMNMSTAGTFTVPLDATLSWPVGASMDIFATGTGEITIAGEAGVTLNATPGLTLRTQWSSATIMKRGANNWVVYGDLKA